MEQIRLDIIPKGLMPVCHSSQYDKGRVIRLNLVDGLQGYTLTDETVTLNVRKPDNNIVTAGVNVISGASYVDIVTTEQMTACEGENLCEIVITKGDVKIASLNFKMKVEVDPLKDGIESETEIHNLETQVADLVSEQYDSNNVIFDAVPTSGHSNGYTVTSEGIKDALDAINNPDASAVNYDNNESGLTATNVQDAINEVNDKADTNTTSIGDLSQLITSDKSSLVGAVNEVNGKGYNDLSGRPIRYYMVSSSNPITIQGQIVSGYATFIIIGFVASLGGVVLAVQMSGGNLSKVIDLLTGSPFSSSHLTFSGSNSQLTIGSDVNSNSNLMIWG